MIPTWEVGGHLSRFFFSRIKKKQSNGSNITPINYFFLPFFSSDNVIEEAESSFNIVLPGHNQNHNQNNRQSSPNKVLDVLDDVIKQHDDEMMNESSETDDEEESRNLENRKFRENEVESDLEEDEETQSKDNDTINEKSKILKYLNIYIRHPSPKYENGF